MKNLFLVCYSLLTSIGIAQNLSDISFGTDSTLEVVTWNIEWFPKNGSITSDSVSKIITALDADIIACQEIDDTVAFNTMLNSISGFSGIYDPNNFEGLAYIYRTSTVIVNDNYSLFTGSNFWRPFPRAPYLLNITYKNETFIIINNHLKCCGDNVLDPSDIDDEENRRLAASELLEDYISSSFQNANVILLGDLNDELTDASNHNVFQPFISSSSDYQFTNLSIANGSSLNWSYPLWPSHLDHILITNELFASFNHPSSTVTTIKVDDYLPAGFSDYDNDISDHRPVGLKLYIDSNTLVVNNYDHLNQFMLYPNPATTSVSVLLKADISTVSLVVYNAFGQLVVNKNLVDKLDISELSSGLYFVQVFENNKPIGIQKLYIQQ